VMTQRREHFLDSPLLFLYTSRISI
jgi:hypothetical protein